MENKKIKFGFSKTTKKTEITSKISKTREQVELIDCLEGQSIKIKDAVEAVKGPLVIPMKAPTKNLIDRVKETKEKLIKAELKEEESVTDASLTLDELAARELIREAKNRNTIQNETKIYSLPLNEDKFVAEGEIEPSLEDYESVPISDYGMAMLRGMGWEEGMPIGKTHSKTVAPIIPEVRPKGLGLGANKMVNANKPSQALDKDGKELQLIKGAYGKIIAGNHKGHYCQVQGLDDENCRIIAKTAISNEILSLNEFLIVPVTKEEYALGSKVINNAKYEEYKEKSDKALSKHEKSRQRGERSGKHNRSRSRDHKKKKDGRNESGTDSDSSSYENNTKSKRDSKKSKKKSKKSKLDYDKRSKKKRKSKYKTSDSESDDSKSDRRTRR